MTEYEQLRLWKGRGKTTHILSEVDREARTAYCDNCGRVKIYFNSVNHSAICAEGVKARVKKSKENKKK